jgi:hypothetical protein
MPCAGIIRTKAAIWQNEAKKRNLFRAAVNLPANNTRPVAAGLLKKLERAKGIEPSTYSLGSGAFINDCKCMAAKLLQ